MTKPKSGITREEYKKQWRQKNNKDKRFNKPLNEYLKLKHQDIYDEYCLFFKSLDEANPTAKDLTKTTGFRKWKENLKNENDQVDESPVIKLNMYIIQDPEKSLVDDEPVTFITATQEVLSETSTQVNEPDTFEAADEELFSEDNNRQEINIEFEQADNIIAEIINNLEQEDAVRELLNADVHPLNDELDEGIGLNLEDEIEPFDFYQEVDFDF